MRVSTTLRLLFTILITFIAVVSAAGGFSKKLKKFWGSKSRSENFERGEPSNTNVESALPGNPTFHDALKTGKCYQARIHLGRTEFILNSQIACKDLCATYTHAFVAIYKAKEAAGYPHFFCNRGAAHFAYDYFCPHPGPLNETGGSGPYWEVKENLVQMLNQLGKFGQLEVTTPGFAALFQQFASGFGAQGAWIGSMVRRFTAFENPSSNEKGTEDQGEKLQTCQCELWITFTRVLHLPALPHMCDLSQFSFFISSISPGWELDDKQTTGTYGETAVPKPLFRHFEQIEAMPGDASGWSYVPVAKPVDQPGFDCIRTSRDERWKQILSTTIFIDTLQAQHSNTFPLQQDQAPHGHPPEPYS